MKIIVLLSALALSSCVPPKAIPVPEVKASDAWDYPAWN